MLLVIFLLMKIKEFVKHKGWFQVLIWLCFELFFWVYNNAWDLLAPAFTELFSILLWSIFCRKFKKKKKIKIYSKSSEKEHLMYL